MNNLLLLLAFSLWVSAAEDLGVISARRAVAIEKVTSRADFSHFVIEVLPKLPPTNIITLTLTNDLLTAAVLARAPDGPGIVGVRSVFKDGAESEVALYRYELRRDTPPRPRLVSVGVSAAVEEGNSLTNELRRIPRVAPPPPPLPGVNQSYAERLDPRKRRNE